MSMFERTPVQQPKGDTVNQVIDAENNMFLVQNNSNRIIRVPQKAKLGLIEDYNYDKATNCWKNA